MADEEELERQRLSDEDEVNMMSNQHSPSKRSEKLLSERDSLKQS